MNKHLAIFVELCQEKQIPLRIIHECGNLLEVTAITGETFLFTVGATPFNDQSIYQLCKDKEFFYDYYQNVIAMPRKKGFLNPNCEPEYQEYLKFKTFKEIIEESKLLFSDPVIVKMNQGSQGKCVFKVSDDKQFKQALTEIYKNDYIALVQSCIDIKSEYRVIYLNKKLMFAYKKNNENATFTGNISPLHFEGAYAEIVENKNLLNAFDEFVQPMLTQKNIPYCGLDIALDKDNKMWLIEGNCSPGFGYLLQNPKGAELLKGLYTEMFKALNILPQQEHSLLMDFWNQNQQKTRV